MKILSILVGLMLVTSTLVGSAYAIPTIQPTQNTNNNNCGTQQNCSAGHPGGGGPGNGDPHGGVCGDGRNAPDGCGTCPGSITPNGPEASDIQPTTGC